MRLNHNTQVTTSSAVKSEKRYIPIVQKFVFSHTIAFIWMIFSIYLSLP
ncbi:MAG: hypothetical protein AB2421_16535 [Thermotaleaceae bacterium]